jgi:hypothetical protein
MAKIMVQCSVCGVRFAVKASAAGRKALCSKCGSTVEIPADAPRMKANGTNFALIVGGFVVLIAVAAGVFFLFIYDPPAPTDSDNPFAAKPRDIVAPAATGQPDDAAAPSDEAAKAMVVVADAIDAMAQDELDAVLEHYTQPISAQARRAIEQQMQRIVDGDLRLEGLEAAVRGRWGMVVMRVVETSVVDIHSSLTEQWLIHRDGRWSMVHNESFSDVDLLMAMDGNFDALAGWFNTNSDALGDRYIEHAVVERELTGIEPATAGPSRMSQATPVASGEKPVAESPESDDGKDALRQVAEDAFAAANDGDYDKAGKLIDIAAVAGDNHQAWWDKQTAGRSMISRAIRTRRITDNDDGTLNVMLRSRKKDGTVLTIIFDVKFENGKWIAVEAAS